MTILKKVGFVQDLKVQSSDPSETPASGRKFLYLKSDGIYTKDASNNINKFETLLYSLGHPALNYTITTSRTGNSETIAIKTLAGNDPSSNDPIKVAFRNSTLGTGDFSVLSLTAGLSITLSSGSTLGTTSGSAFRIWLVIFNDSGTARLGVINCLSSLSIYPLRDTKLESSTAEGGSGAADSSQVIYTGTAVTSKAFRILGYLEYTLTTAGTWNTAPSVIQLISPTTPLPNQIVQTQTKQDNTKTSGATALPTDNTIPQITEGFQFLTLTMAPTSAINLLVHNHVLNFGINADVVIGIALFQGAISNALYGIVCSPSGGFQMNLPLLFTQVAGTTSSTTWQIRAGNGTPGTVYMNSYLGTSQFGGVIYSSMSINEIMV